MYIYTCTLNKIYKKMFFILEEFGTPERVTYKDALRI